MSNRTLQQIDFAITSGGKRHTFSLTPLKKKTAANIFHNILLSVLDTITAVIGGDDVKEEEILAGLAKGLKSLDFDSFWFIAERLFQFAVVDDVDTKKLEDADWWVDNNVLLYKATLKAIKENYPNVFLSLGLDDLFQPKKPKEKEQLTGDTQEQK